MEKDNRRIPLFHANCLFLLSVLMLGAYRFLPISPLMSEVNAYALLGTAIELTAFVLPGMIYLLATRRSVAGCVRMKRLTPPQIVVLVFIGVTAYVAVVFFNVLWVSLLSLLGGEVGALSLPATQDMRESLAVLFATAMVPAFSEEFLFRGVLFPAWQRQGRTMAIVWTGALFSLMHMSVQTLVFTLLLGILFAWTAYRTDSLWSGVILHMVINSIGTGLSFLFTYLQSTDLMRQAARQAQMIRSLDYLYAVAAYGVIAAGAGAVLVGLIFALKSMTATPEPEQPVEAAPSWQKAPAYVAGALCLAVVVLDAVSIFGGA